MALKFHSQSFLVSDEPEAKVLKGDPKLVASNDQASTSKMANGSTHKTSKIVAGRTEQSGKSIQKDPNATKAFKSLFTTSDKAKNQQTPHWITYNPCYY